MPGPGCEPARRPPAHEGERRSDALRHL